MFDTLFDPIAFGANLIDAMANACSCWCTCNAGAGCGAGQGAGQEPIIHGDCS